MTSKVREQGEKVRTFILEAISGNKVDVVPATMAKFSITRQAVNKHIHKLKEQGAINVEGTTRAPKYTLCSIVEVTFFYEMKDELQEDLVWSKDIRPAIEPLPENVLRIWSYAFTEMFNNAIDHSNAKSISVSIKKNALTTDIRINDNGVGIFKKIQGELDLIDERLAIFELSKGKLTTDPANHSGQGIFFTSRMMDDFSILSGGLFFSHKRVNTNDWLLESSKQSSGTFVWMILGNHTARTTKKVFDEFSVGDDDYAFNKTIVPLSLAKFGPDELVSRSQAKRVLDRVNLFKFVIFDFKDVNEIGQAFADQIFRVYANEHPDISLLSINMKKSVKDMIDRAKNTTKPSL